MTNATNIVNKLLEADDDTSPEVVAHYIGKAGSYGLLVPDPLPEDKASWHVLVRQYPKVLEGKPCVGIRGSVWKLAGEWPTKEEGDAQANAFLRKHKGWA